MPESLTLHDRLRGIEALRSMKFVYYVVAYRVWSYLVPLRSDRILFVSDSSATYSSNLAMLRDELRKRSPGTRIAGVFKPALRSRRRLSDLARLPYLMAASATIVLDDYFPLIYPIKLRHGTRLVQVWHAAGALKRVGHSRRGLPGGPTARSRIHHNYTHVIVSAESVRAHYSEAFGVPMERVLPLGMPRSDLLFDREWARATRERVRRGLGVGDSTRLVCFAPTFRGRGQVSAHAVDVVDWEYVSARLGDGWQVAVRWHPFTIPTAPALPGSILNVSTGFEMNELLTAADVLVTDYSSAIFEFAVLRRPIVFYTPDLEEYGAARGFYRPFDDYAIGPIVDDRDGLVEAIRTADVDEARFERFIDEFCGALDGRSTQRIVAELLGPVYSPAREAVRA